MKLMLQRSKAIFYFVLLLSMSFFDVNAQTPVPMVSQPSNTFTENFADIANWTNNFAAGAGANRWASYPVTTGGTANDGKRTTKSSATFVTTTAGGVQKGTQSLVFLSTGSGATSEAVAVDLLLDFTGVNAGTLSFIWAAVDNGNGTRPTSLRVFWSIDNSTFTEISAAQILDIQSVNSGSITNVTLPTAFNNSATARLRFYNHAGAVTGGGSRDKISIDDVTVTATPAGPIITASGTLASLSSTYGTPSSATQFTVSGVLMNDGITITPPAGFEVATSSDFSTTIGSSIAPLVIGAAGTISNTLIYVRIAASASAGNKSGSIVLSSASASAVNVATNATNTVNTKELTITGITIDDKPFDNTTSATISGMPALVGVVTGDVPNVNLGGTPIANFNDVTVNINKPVTVSGYTISGSAAGNYFLTQPTGLTASILPSGLLDQTIIFAPLSPVTYGVASFNLAATASSNLTVSYTSLDTDIATVTGNVVTVLKAGTVTIIANQVGNGSYNPAISVSQSLLVNPKELTFIGATAGDKEYDATTLATITGGSLAGVINADDVSFSGAGNFATVNVGTQSVTGNLVLAGADAPNYFLTQPVLSAAITPKEVTISGITIANKEYDTMVSATIVGTPVLNGILAADVSNVSIGGTPVAIFNDASVEDNKPVTVSGYLLSGDSLGNYFLTQPTGLTANITLISLDIVGLTAANKVYDRTITATVSGTASLSGILPGDEANVGLAGTANANFTTATAGNAKTVDVTGYSLSGTSLGNYTLSPLTLIADITKKDVTIDTPSVSDKLYDGTTTATLSGTLSGVISPDSVTLNLVANFANATVGVNKPVISTSTLSGTDALNYQLVHPLSLTASITAGPCGSASSGNVTWNFATAAPSTTTSTGIAISNVSQGNNNGTTTLITSVSVSNYLGASGTTNAGAASLIGSLNTASSTYFQFTLTPEAGFNVALTGFSFGSRCTNSGPQAYSLRSSIDGFVSNVASGTLANNSVWIFHTPTVIPTSSSNGPITYRLYGHNGLGTTSVGVANWRIDDLNLTLNVVPVAPLSSSATAVTCSGDTFSYVPTSVYPEATFTWTRAAVSGISNTAVTTPQTSNPSEVLINTTNAPIDVIYEYTITTATCYLTQNVTVTVNNCSSIVNLKLFVEGYYVGSNLMTTVADNQAGVPPSSTDVELITVELHNATSPYSIVETTTAMLQTDGTAVCAFTNAPNGSFYIAVKTRNAVQTWSALPQTVGSTPLAYDFTTSSSQAFADNMTDLGGVFGFYSGDINDGVSQDGNIDSSDYSLWEADNNDFAFGAFATDLNGDGNVDAGDYSIWESNNNNFIFANYPTP